LSETKQYYKRNSLNLLSFKEGRKTDTLADEISNKMGGGPARYH
jgi:hypothetical protein